MTDIDSYQFLKQIVPPKMIVEALKLLDVKETPGKLSTPQILLWGKELSLEETYSTDSIAWCGLFVGVVAFRAGKTLPPNLLWAKAWSNFGTRITPDKASLGDVLVFNRKGGGGHVGLYIAEDETTYHVLGGNQSDMVCITRIEKARLYTVQRPHYNKQPESVKKYYVNAAGKLSTNEQ